MIAITEQQKPASEAAHKELFLQFLPAIERYAGRAFTTLREQEREEAVAEVVANAFAAFQRLARRGKLDVAYPGALARFAVAQVRAGRRVGNKPNVRDVFSFLVQRRNGFRVESWQLVKTDFWLAAVTDNTVTEVPDQVAFRIDFPAWLAGLKRRDRELIEFLSLGHGTSDAAQRFRLTAARISQLRARLKASWQAFQTG